MLAATVTDLTLLRYPLLATPKIDGIRCVIQNDRDSDRPCDQRGALWSRTAVSRNLKPIPNDYIRSTLSMLAAGYDGEIVCPGGFNATQSAVMSREGTPPFKYLVFDKSCNAPYFQRVAELKLEFSVGKCAFAEPLLYDQIDNEDDLLDYERIALEQNYEGVMLRLPNGPYKHGRSTFREHYLLKLKRFLDSEAVIEDFEEKQHNANEATTDNLGYTERSSHKSGMVGADTLGAVWVRDCKTGDRFSIGSGFDDNLRRQIWNNRNDYVGQTIVYKYQPSGMKDLPRFPVFKGFRPKGA